MTSVGSIHEGFGSEQDDYTSPKKKKIICEEIEKDKLPCKSADTFLGEAYILVSCVLVTLKNYGRSTPFFITLVLNKKKLLPATMFVWKWDYYNYSRHLN